MGGRVVECARLESVLGLTVYEGSNPSPSAARHGRPGESATVHTRNNPGIGLPFGTMGVGLPPKSLIVSFAESMPRW